MTLREPPKEQRAVNIIGRFVGLIILLALFAVVVWTVATNQQAAAVQRADPVVHAPGEHMSVSPGIIHHLTVGSGGVDTLFLHHETIAGAGPLLPLATQLAEHDRQVLLPDLVGYGFSSRPAEPGRRLSTTGQAETLAAFLEETGGGPYEVVGFGWGGEVATELAVLRPDLTSRLVMVDTPALPVPRDGLYQLEAMPFGVGEAVAYTFDGAGSRAEGRFLEDCPSWAECSDAEILESYRRAASVPGTAGAIRARRASDPAFVAPGRLDEVTVPVTVVAVDMARSEADALAEEFPEAEATAVQARDLAATLAG